MTDSVSVGAARITRVVEWVGSVASTDVVFPESDAADWDERKGELAPDFWEPETNAYRNTVQSWVLHVDGQVIIVDTGVGNGRARPHMLPFDHLETDYLRSLAQAGVSPGDVDLVINTHLHNDHVGWNTTSVDGTYAPTFPNATYLMANDDVEFYRPGGGGHRTANAPLMVNVFEDSIAPILDAGQATRWEGRYQINEILSLEAAPGHTPGTSVLKLVDGSDKAVFAADTLHSPLQVDLPHLNSCFCEDVVRARRSRTSVLRWAADQSALVLPAHLGGHSAFEVRAEAGRFHLTGWAPFDRI